MNNIFYKFLLLSLLFVSANITAQTSDCDIFELLDPIPNGQLSLDNPPVPCGFEVPGSGIYVNQCSPCGRKVSDDDCTATPNPTLCELDGFVTTTSGFTADVDPLGVGFCNGAGSIENNFWVGFTAQTNLVSLSITMSNCNNTAGIQVAIVETDCVSTFNTMQGPSPCNFNGVSNNTDIFTATNLVAGNPYYIMFDGFAGDVCDIVIEVLDGFDTPEFETVAVPPGELCPDILNPGSYTSQDGSGAQVVVTTGGIATTDLTFYWLDPNGTVIATTDPDVILGNQVYGSLDGSFFDQVGIYTVEIIDNGSCCPLCTSVDLLISDPPAAAAAIISGINGAVELNCTNDVVDLEGNPDDGSVPYAESWTIVDGAGDRQQLDISLVGTNGRINEYSLTRATVEFHFPGQEVGVATMLYGFLDDLDQLCFGDAFVEVPFDFRLPDIDIDSPADIDCALNPTVELNASNTDTYGHNATYAWTYQDGTTAGIASGGDTDRPEVGLDGFYTLVVTDLENGCVDSMQVEVEGMVDPPTLTPILDTMINCINNQSIDVSSTGDAGGVPIIYSWEGPNGTIVGETNPTLTVTEAGMYILTAQNSINQCVAFTSFTVGDGIPVLAIDAFTANTITCIDQTVTFPTAVVSGGAGDYTYSWTDANAAVVSSTADLTATVDGVYTLTVTDVASGCTEVQTATVMIDQDAPQLDALTDIELTCTTMMETATANAADLTGAAIAGVEYEWFDATMNSISTVADFEFSTAGTFTVIATNPNNGCESTAGTIIITVNDTPPAASIQTPGVIGCGASSTVTLVGEPATGTYTYQWYEGADATGTALGTASTEDVTIAGDYTLVVTDTANGCSSAPVTVSVIADNTVPTPIIATPEVLDCTKVDNNAGVDLDASATVGTNLSYAWTDPSSASVGGDNAVISVTEVGTYTLIVTDTDNGCISNAVTVTVLGDFDAPTGVTATGGTLDCDPTSTGVMLVATGTCTGTATYTWFDSGMVEYMGPNPVVTTSGDFTLIVTCENGCTETATATVMRDQDSPVVMLATVAGLLEPLSCDNPERQILGSVASPSSDITLTWYDPSNNALADNPLVLNEFSAPGVYTFIALNTTNGCSNSNTVQTTADFSVPVFTATGGNILCEPNDMVALDAVSDIPADFTWSDPSGTVISSQQAGSVTTPGTYSVFATSISSGCSSAPMTVEVTANNQNPTAMAAPNTSLTCFAGGDSYNLAGTGSAANGTDPVSFSWSLNNGPEISTVADFVATEVGIYTLTVTNTVSNCTETATVEIDDARDTPLGVANFADGNTVLNCDNPMVNLTGGSDDPNATYQWTSEMGTVLDGQDQTVTESGEWILIVTSPANGCTSDPSSVTVLEDFTVPENVMITGDSEITCDPGFIQMIGSTSTMNVTYLWTLDNNATYTSTETSPTVTETGLYTLTVTGANGCTETATFDVTRDEGVPAVGATPDGILTCENISVTITGTSSAMNSSFAWTGPGGFVPTSTQDIVVTIPGDYILTVVDTDNSCPGAATATVTINDDTPDVTTTTTTVNCDPSEVFTLTASAAMVNNAEFAWSGPGMFTSDVSNPVITEPGDYMVTVTDPVNGCFTIEDVVALDGRDLPDDLATQVDIMILTCDNETSTLSASSATPGEYTWTGGNISATVAPSIMVTEPGVYEVTFLDPANGCSVTLDPITIDQDITAPMIVEETPLILDCQRMEVALAVTNNEDITYEWSDVSGPLASATDASPLVTEPGIYTVVVTAVDNGCTSMLTLEVMQDMNIPLSIPAASELTCEFTEVALDGSASSAGPSITYNWTNSAGISISTDMSTTATEPGEYTLTVSNSDNDCQIDSMITVEIDDLAPTAEAGMADVFPCGVDFVSLSGSGTGQGALSYTWIANDGGAIVGDQADIDVTQSGTFTLTVLDADNGCIDTDEVVITPDENKPDIVTEDIEVLTCNVTSVELSAVNTVGQGNLTFTWTFDENNTNAGTGETISVTSPGQYTVLVVDESNDCDDRRTVTVIENIAEPTFNTEGGETDCLTGTTSVTIVDLNITGAAYSWTGPGTFTSTDQDLLNVSDPGDYFVTVTDSDNGCSSIGMATVISSMETPSVDIADADMIDCDTEEVQLTGEADAGLSYSWSGPNILSGGNTLTPVVGEAGEYTLTVIDPDNNCAGSSSIDVLENTNVITSISPEGDDVNCFGPNTGSIGINQNEVIGGTAPYVYSVDGGENFSTQQEFLGLTAGMYDVVVMDANGCEFELPITINAADNLTLDLGENQVITYGDSIMLSPQANFTIDVVEWNDSTLIVEEPWVRPLNTTSYEVVVFDEDGCITTDNITVFVEKTRPVYIPTAFSPDGDGINDFFTVFADLGLITMMYDFSIYDRWGEKLHEVDSMTPEQALDRDFGWDGIHRGEDMNPGVYVYKVLVEFVDGEEIFYEGNFTLVR